jgi:hypothetical protein
VRIDIKNTIKACGKGEESERLWCSGYGLENYNLDRRKGGFLDSLIPTPKFL